MREWREEVRRQVAAAGLAPADEAEVVEELAQHLEDRHHELLAAGLSPRRAAAAVRQELRAGGPLAAALDGLRPRGGEPLPLGGGGRDGLAAGLWRDLRVGLRGLAASPAYTATVVLTLALGAGAATAVFTLLHGIVLRPLPYPAADRLVTIWETRRAEGLDHEAVSPVNFLDYRRLDTVFADAAAWWRPEVALADGDGEPLQVPTVEASENLFEVLGVAPALGRAFPRDESLHGDEAEALISDRLWRRAFGADPAVLGRQVDLDGAPYTVVGVMPAGFHFPGDTDVWQRLSWDLAQHNRGAHFMEAVGRLRPGIGVEEADRELAAVGRRLAAEAPSTNEGWSARAVPLAAEVVGAFGPGLYALLGASGLLLLIACINVANLGLARGAARRGEVALRLALGADRLRLLRQFAVESTVLAVAGAAGGLAVAALGVRALLAWSPIAIPRADQVRLDARVLVFAVAVAALMALVFGIAPAVATSGSRLRQALEGTVRGRAGGRRGQRLRRLLVVTEVAFSVALLCGAGLLIRSVAAMLAEETGVRTAEAVTVDLQLPTSTYPDWDRVGGFYADLLDSLAAHPRVRAAGAANFLPLETGWRIPFAVAGEPPARPGEERVAQYHSVGGDYFAALGVPLLAGRLFRPADTPEAPGVVVVNQALARRLAPAGEAVGRRIVATGRVIGPLGRRLVVEDVHEVVGVVGDVRNGALDAAVEPAIYSAQRQFPFRKMRLVVRGEGGEAALVALVRAQVRRADPTVPVGLVGTVEDLLAAPAGPSRFVMMTMTVFAAVALLLAVVGIYGLLTYSFSQRRREFGIRIALGAGRGDILRLALDAGLALALPGVLLGLLAALAGGRLLAGLLYAVAAADPATLAAVAALVLAVSVAACLAPGRRAAAVDPVVSLRLE